MSHRRDSGSDVVHVRTTNDPPPETWFQNSGDNSVWATEDDYNRVCAMNTDDAESSSKKIRSSSSEIGKSFFKTKLCFKFRAGTCPYAASSCHFAHSSEELRRPPPPNRQETATEASRNREIFAIPRGYGAASDGGNVAQTLKSPNWKTRICNKWEITGYCPFGTNCHFAHGASELHRFGGGLVEGEGKIGTYTTPDTKQTGLVDTVTSLVSPGVPSQRTSNAVTQKPRKWKGPDKISRVYGDWIDDIE